VIFEPFTDEELVEKRRYALSRFVAPDHWSAAEIDVCRNIGRWMATIDVKRDDFRIAYENKVADFAAETLRSSGLQTELTRAREAIQTAVTRLRAVHYPAGDTLSVCSACPESEGWPCPEEEIARDLEVLVWLDAN
jgi:hypothetical protein